MLISESHKFIFLAIAKTGTSSIETALSSYRSPLTGNFSKHATCVKLQRELPENIWGSYFKFAFVRNPYDRMQSWYFYRKRAELANPAHPRHHRYTGNITFDEFIETFSKRDWMLNQVAWVAPPALGGEMQVDFVGRYETLEDDFRKVCHRIGVPHSPLPTIRNSHNDASAAALWNSHTRSVINEYFRQDFETFGYEMLHNG